MASALKVVATGRVQGVGFREYVQRRGQSLGLSGYVTNLADGTLEVYGEGNARALRSLLRVPSKGPPLAEVSAVKEEWTTPRGETGPFRIIL